MKSVAEFSGSKRLTRCSSVDTLQASLKTLPAHDGPEPARALHATWIAYQRSSAIQANAASIAARSDASASLQNQSAKNACICALNKSGASSGM